MGNDNIILVGFMATGKTTIGKLLAKSLDFDFKDTDQLVEEIEEKSISSIFKLNGEHYFRKKESEALDLLKHLDRKVISTGGGIVTLEDNRRRIKALGNVIYLESSPQWILTNLTRSKVTRPLLKDEKDPLSKIIELLEKRKEFYEDVAEFKICVDEKPLNEIVNNIISKIQSTP